MTLIIVLAIAAVLVLWFIRVQNNLVSKDELCKNALSQIGVQQSSRWDALTALAELVKSYNEHEYNSLKDIIAMRKGISGTSNVEDANAQEELMAQATKMINVVVERYPDLKANENYAKAMDAVNTYENQVRMSRMVFNDTVTKYNKLTRQIPDSIIASILGFQAREYLKEVESKADMPSMKI
ncbi:MAG: LemA family protein [Bacteroidales bacterium]|nr:LemA family protein [Bacteroidales bacterium]